MKIALLQMIPVNNEKANQDKAVKFCKEAKQKGAHLAVFPELFNVDYEKLLVEYNSDNSKNKQQTLKIMQEKAIGLNSNFVLTFKKLSKELDMAIGVTFLEKTKGLPKNSVAIFDRHGELVLKYSKIHTVDFKMEILMEPGDDFYVCNLDIGSDIIKVGAAICYDRDFPETFISLMLKGAEVVIVPNACDMRKIILDELKIRAYENAFGIVCVNAPIYGKDVCSSAYSPIVRRKDASDKIVRELDPEILVMKETEEVGIAEFNMKEIRKYREDSYHGDAYRKPWKYKALLDEKIEEPFKRNVSRRKNNKESKFFKIKISYKPELFK